MFEDPGFTVAAPPVTCHMTPTPLTGLPNWSAAVAWSGSASAVLTMPVCMSPPVLAMLAAGPAVAVAVNVWGDPFAPETAAVTVCAPAV